MNDAELTKAIFGPTLNAFSGQSNAIKTYQEVTAMSDTVKIVVIRPEVTIHPRVLHANDVHFDRTVQLSDVDTQVAFDRLMNEPEVVSKLYEIIETMRKEYAR